MKWPPLVFSMTLAAAAGQSLDTLKKLLEVKKRQRALAMQGIHQEIFVPAKQQVTAKQVNEEVTAPVNEEVEAAGAKRTAVKAGALRRVGAPPSQKKRPRLKGTVAQCIGPGQNCL